ncbi:MAG: type II secretion system protein GspK [Bdellovibrionales bacterium]|nr:type II secretion system protein GspK [Bdellovibrionales bacterium]
MILQTLKSIKLRLLSGRLGNEKSERGAALMLALFATTLLMVIATEIMYETSVEYVVSTQSVNQVRAYWAARAGTEMSLLRIHIYRQALAMGASQLPDPKILDEIWRQPFLWPPPIPESMTIAEGDDIKKAVQSSDLTALKVSYLSTIEAEGAKVDINDLGSPSKIMAEAARRQLKQIFDQRIENDEDFSKRFRGFDFEEVINNIADWIDSDDAARNGGSERQAYSDQPRSTFFPPNQPLRTLPELHQVAGMTDELYDLIAPAITLYGGKGISVNQATKDVFKAFGTGFTDERIDRIIADRQDPKRGPFKDEEDFIQYLSSIGITGNPFDLGEGAKVPLVFEPETIFKIRSTGKSGQAQSDITAIVYDADKVRGRLEKALVQEATKATSGAANGGTGTSGSGAQTGDQDGKSTTADGKDANKADSPAAPQLKRPKIVYWNEQ